jgi:hypothetical protein
MGAIARFNEWSKRFPNARLAAVGLILIYVPGGLAKVIEQATIAFCNFLNETPNNDFYIDVIGKVVLVVIGLLMVPMVVGMVMIPFAAYRAIRDYYIRR